MDIIITVQVQGGANLKIPFDDTLEQVGFWWGKSIHVCPEQSCLNRGGNSKVQWCLLDRPNGGQVRTKSYFYEIAP
jgi:hypothetical protein